MPKMRQHAKYAAVAYLRKTDVPGQCGYCQAVLQENASRALFLYILVKNEPILTISGTQNPVEI